MTIPEVPESTIAKDLPLCQIRFSEPNSIDPPIQDICKYLEKVVRCPQLDHSTLQRVLRAVQRWLKSVSGHETVELGIVSVLAKVFDALLQKDYGKSDVLNSLLDIIFLVEDIAEVTGGKEACGPYFISRLLAIAPTKLASVNLRRAAAETLCVLITRCSANQQALLERRTDCLLLFNFLESKCGDFQLQASIAEISYRLSRRDPGFINSIKDETYKCALQSLLEVKRPNLLAEIRDLVMLVNNSMGQFRSVYSFSSDWVKINGRTVTAAEERWIDFGRTLFSFHALSEPVSTPSAAAEYRCPKIFDILYVDIVDFKQSTAKQLEIIVNKQINLQSPVKDQAFRDGRMHIEISFPEGDICVLLKCVLPKILPSGTKGASINLSKSAEDFSSGLIIRKSSQGIMIPLLSGKDDMRSPNVPDIHQSFVPNSVKSVFRSAKVAPKNILEVRGQTGTKILHSEHNTAVGLGTRVDESNTKNLSPCSQVIDEALSSHNVNEISLVLQCEVGGAANVVPMNNFKVPAAKSKSMSGCDSQLAARILQKENVIPMAPLKEVAGLSGDRSNMIQGPMKDGCGDNDVEGKDDGDTGKLVKVSNKYSQGNATEHPSAGDRYIDRKQGNSIPKLDKTGLEMTNKAANVPEVPFFSELDEFIVTVEGPEVDVRSLKSKSVGLEEKHKAKGSVDGPAEESNKCPKLTEALKEEDIGTGLPKQAVPAVTQKEVCIRKHKRTVVNSAECDYKQEGNKLRKCTDKMSKLITNDHLESHSKKLDGKGTVSAPKPHEEFLSKLEQLGRKRPLGITMEKNTAASVYKKRKPTLNVAPNTHSVYSFSGGLDFEYDKKKRGRPRKEAMKVSSKRKKIVLDSNTNTPPADLSAEKVQTAKRPRGRPRKIVAVGSSYQTPPDTKTENVCSPCALEVVLDLQSNAAENDEIQLENTKVVLNSNINTRTADLSSQTEKVLTAKRPRDSPSKVDVIRASPQALPDTKNDKVLSPSPPEVIVLDLQPDAAEENGMQQGNRKSPVLSSEMREISPGVCRSRQGNVENEAPVSETLGAVSNEKIWARPSTENLGMFQQSKMNSRKRITVPTDGGPLEQKANEKVCSKLKMPIADVPLEVVPHPPQISDVDVIEAPDRAKRHDSRRDTMHSTNNCTRIIEELAFDHRSAHSNPSSDSAKFHVHGSEFQLAQAENNDISGSPYEGNGPVEEPQRESPKDNTLISSTKKRAACVTSEAKLDDPYSIISSPLGRDNLESLVARAYRPHGNREARLIPGAQAEVEIVFPLKKSNGPSVFSDEGNEEQQRESPEDNILISSTNIKAALVTSDAKLDDPLLIPSSLGRDKLESPVSARLYKPSSNPKERATPQLLREDGLRSLVRTSRVIKRNPQESFAEKKNPSSNSPRRLPEQGKRKKSKKTQFRKGAKSIFDLKYRNRAAETDREVDVYYSTPLSAGQKRRSIPHLSSDSSRGRATSNIPQSDEVVHDSVFESTDWGRRLTINTQHRRRVLPCPGKDYKYDIADFEPHVQNQLVSKGQSKCKGQVCKVSEGPKVKFTSLAASTGDDVMQDRAKQGRSDSFVSPEKLPRELPICKSQISSQVSKGPKVKFTTPLAAHNGDDNLDRAKQGRSESMSTSSESLPPEFVKFTTPLAAHNGDDNLDRAKQGRSESMSTSMKSREMADSGFGNEDEDGELSRSVILVQKMLEKFRRKVEIQVKERTNKVLDTVLQNLESEVDSFNAQVQQDLDDFVNTYTRKFEDLESKRQDYLEKGRIWQEKVAQEFKLLVQESKDLFSNIKLTEVELKAMAEKQRTGHKSLLCQLQETAQQNLENAERKISTIRKNVEQLHGLRDILKCWV